MRRSWRQALCSPPSHHRRMPRLLSMGSLHSPPAPRSVRHYAGRPSSRPTPPHRRPLLLRRSLLMAPADFRWQLPILLQQEHRICCHESFHHLRAKALHCRQRYGSRHHLHLTAGARHCHHHIPPLGQMPRRTILSPLFQTDVLFLLRPPRNRYR